MKVPPLAGKTHQEIQASIDAAIRADPRIGELLGLARELAPAPSLEHSSDLSDEFWQAIGSAGDLLWRTKVGEFLPRSECARIALMFALADFPRAEDGRLLPIRGEVRVTGIPGIEGRPLWVLQTQADVAAMRDTLAAGQVWVRADSVKSDDWPRVRALASDAFQRVLGGERPAGRPRGSGNALRERLLDEIRANPNMSREDVDRLGVGMGVWENALGDYTLMDRRVARARKDASKNP